MREWLILQLTRFLQFIFRAGKQPEEEEGKAEEEKKIALCPICGEEWEEDAIFCCYCGYEQSDEDAPLHPPPERTGSLTDPDKILVESDFNRISEKLKAVADEKGFDIAVLVLPKGLRGNLDSTDEESENKLPYTPDGIAYALYNDWEIGKESGLKGVLLAIDPHGRDRVLVRGRKGPAINGSVFREWYGNYKLPENETDPAGLLIKELDYIAGVLSRV